MRKSQNKKKKKVNLTSRKRFLKVIPILLFAAVGAYVLLKSYAQEYSTQDGFSIAYRHKNYVDNTVVPPGQMITFDWWTGYSYNPSNGIKHFVFIFSSDSNRAKLKQFTCAPSLQCSWVNWKNYESYFSDAVAPSSDYGYNYFRGDKIALCYDLPATYATAIDLIYVEYTSKTSEPLQAPPYWITSKTIAAPGTCSKNPTATGGTVTARFGGCADVANPYWGTAACDFGYDPSNDSGQGYGIKPGNGQTGLNTGIEGEGQGPGIGTGGGGGSSANKQSNRPNNVPTTSAQGDNNQPDLEPSPFFDGKQYEPGSDPDLLGVNTTFSIAGHNLKYGWAYVFGLLALVGGGGYCVWRKYPKFVRKKIKQLRSKLP